MIKINKNQLALVSQKAERFAQDREAQEALVQLLNAQKEINDLVDSVKNSLKTSLEASKLDFVEGDLVKVATYESGVRYVLTDQDKAPPEVLEVKLSPKAVEAYRENNSKLPDGVEEKPRGKTIRITLK